MLSNSTSKRKIIREILHHEGCPTFYLKYTGDIPQDIPLKSFADFNSQITPLPGIGKKFPREIIARTNKAELRKAVVNAVKERLFGENMPYLHVAYYPKGYQTIVTFRIDCDETDQADFDRVLHYADLNDFPLTFFIHVNAQKSYLTHIASTRERGHDIQLHCYEHETVEDYRQNKKNISKGKKLMKESGINVTGFASPYGKWNPSLNRVLKNLKFSFSSEFAMGYDDLPFYPVFNGHVSKVLQLPVHPICIGLLSKAGLLREEMRFYFERVIREKFERKNPIMLYGHPYKEIDQYPEIFDYILSYLKQLPDVWITTYSGFYDWWKKRLHTDFSVRFKNDKVQIITNNSDSSLQVNVVKPDNSETTLPLKNSSILLKNLI